MTPLRIGPIELAAPVVLAPMAGVTNAPFRALCRRDAPGLLYVNEMVMAVALLHGNAKTERILTTNGGLPVALLNGTVPAADQKTAITTARST